MVCAIYPRKSKANDNSQSMAQQVSDCERYINEHYPDAIIRVYDADYALTGHSTARRKDFQRMMNDVRHREIQLVVIMRYDRIARNMRDFCNLYHDMEENGCNLVSVSQQIDTSTPYGKNFMYQMASMAELEWAITSERYKDTARYKIEQGLAYYGTPPKGFIVQICEDGKKRFVHDPEYEQIARTALEMYHTYKSKRYVVRWIRENMDSEFQICHLTTMINSDLFFGSCRDNESFCEPYFDKNFIMELRGMKQVKSAPTGRVYLFKGLMRCPYCGYLMHGYGRSTQDEKNPEKKNPLYKYYNCKRRQDLWSHLTVNIAENNIERQLIEKIKPFLDDYMVQTESRSSKANKSTNKNKTALKDELERLNYMFEKGRIKLDYYEKRYEELTAEIEKINGEKPSNLEHIKASFSDNWMDTYKNLSDNNKQAFWNGILQEIIISEDKKITSVIFRE